MEKELEIKQEVITKTVNDTKEKQTIKQDRIVKVYVDEVNNRYYIDVAAAFELGIIDYKSFTKNYDIGILFYPITLKQLRLIQEDYQVEFIVLRKLERVPMNNLNNIDPNFLNDNHEDKSKYDKYFDKNINKLK